MNTTIGKTKIMVAKSDITQLEVDAIATASGTDLHMRGEVAAAIKAAGGEGIEHEAVLQGPIEVGGTVATTGHGLNARWVIHVALTNGTPQAGAEEVAAATRAVLDRAVRCQASSIAVPAFGTGACEVPSYLCAKAMVAAVADYLRERRRTPLRQIMFVVNDAAGRAAFTDAVVGING